MRSKASVTEVARHFANHIDRVAFRGERFTLMRGSEPVAELGPVPVGRRRGELPDHLAALPPLGREDAFSNAEDLEGARDARAARAGSVGVSIDASVLIEHGPLRGPPWWRPGTSRAGMRWS
jgi:antitoxin (DNA-binding transcriptional repressor) of toxin-antitoxin stability system